MKPIKRYNDKSTILIVRAYIMKKRVKKIIRDHSYSIWNKLYQKPTALYAKKMKQMFVYINLFNP